MERLLVENSVHVLDEDPEMDDDTIIERWVVTTKSEGEDAVILPCDQSLMRLSESCRGEEEATR